VPLEVSAKKVNWGDIPAVLSVAVDITERLKAKEALQESGDRFNRAIVGTGAGLWDWDMVNNTVFFSRKWKSMLGYEGH
jgi:PAS domain-containing protein